MRSPAGASAELLRLVRQGRVVMPLTVTLAIEYEATCSAVEHRQAAGLNAAEVDQFIDAVVALGESTEAFFLWRPQLRDPADEMVLEAAVNGRAGVIATFNQRDFGSAPLRFGIEVLRPAAIIRRLWS